MMHRIVKYFTDIPSMYIDGTLKTVSAVLAAIIISFTSDTADKYISPVVLWWITQIILWLSAGIATVIAFRSTSFSKHVENKKKEQENETQIYKNNNSLPPAV